MSKQIGLDDAVEAAKALMAQQITTQPKRTPSSSSSPTPLKGNASKGAAAAAATSGNVSQLPQSTVVFTTLNTSASLAPHAHTQSQQTASERERDLKRFAADFLATNKRPTSSEKKTETPLPLPIPSKKEKLATPTSAAPAAPEPASPSKRVKREDANSSSSGTSSSIQSQDTKKSFQKKEDKIELKKVEKFKAISTQQQQQQQSQQQPPHQTPTRSISAAAVSAVVTAATRKQQAATAAAAAKQSASSSSSSSQQSPNKKKSSTQSQSVVQPLPNAEKVKRGRKSSISSNATPASSTKGKKQENAKPRSKPHQQRHETSDEDDDDNDEEGEIEDEEEEEEDDIESDDQTSNQIEVKEEFDDEDGIYDYNRHEHQQASKRTRRSSSAAAATTRASRKRRASRTSEDENDDEDDIDEEYDDDAHHHARTYSNSWEKLAANYVSSPPKNACLYGSTVYTPLYPNAPDSPEFGSKSQSREHRSSFDSCSSELELPRFAANNSPTQPAPRSKIELVDSPFGKPFGCKIFFDEEDELNLIESNSSEKDTISIIEQITSSQSDPIIAASSNNSNSNISNNNNSNNNNNNNSSQFTKVEACTSPITVPIMTQSQTAALTANSSSAACASSSQQTQSPPPSPPTGAVTSPPAKIVPVDVIVPAPINLNSIQSSSSSSNNNNNNTQSSSSSAVPQMGTTQLLCAQLPSMVQITQPGQPQLSSPPPPSSTISPQQYILLNALKSGFFTMEQFEFYTRRLAEVTSSLALNNNNQSQKSNHSSPSTQKQTAQQQQQQQQQQSHKQQQSIFDSPLSSNHSNSTALNGNQHPHQPLTSQVSADQQSSTNMQRQQNQSTTTSTYVPSLLFSSPTSNNANNSGNNNNNNNNNNTFSSPPNQSTQKMCPPQGSFTLSNQNLLMNFPTGQPQQPSQVQSQLPTYSYASSQGSPQSNREQSSQQGSPPTNRDIPQSSLLSTYSQYRQPQTTTTVLSNITNQVTSYRRQYLDLQQSQSIQGTSAAAAAATTTTTASSAQASHTNSNAGSPAASPAASPSLTSNVFREKVEYEMPQSRAGIITTNSSYLHSSSNNSSNYSSLISIGTVGASSYTLQQSNHANANANQPLTQNYENCTVHAALKKKILPMLEAKLTSKNQYENEKDMWLCEVVDCVRQLRSISIQQIYEGEYSLLLEQVYDALQALSQHTKRNFTYVLNMIQRTMTDLDKKIIKHLNIIENKQISSEHSSESNLSVYSKQNSPARHSVIANQSTYRAPSSNIHLHNILNNKNHKSDGTAVTSTGICQNIATLSSVTKVSLSQEEAQSKSGSIEKLTTGVIAQSTATVAHLAARTGDSRKGSPGVKAMAYSSPQKTMKRTQRNEFETTERRKELTTTAVTDSVSMSEPASDFNEHTKSASENHQSSVKNEYPEA